MLVGCVAEYRSELEMRENPHGLVLPLSAKALGGRSTGPGRCVNTDRGRSARPCSRRLTAVTVVREGTWVAYDDLSTVSSNILNIQRAIDYRWTESDTGRANWPGRGPR